MLCFDTNLLGDYLDGRERAREFLANYERERWAIPSMGLFEAYMGAIYGRPRGSVEDVFEATRSFEILPVDDDVALRAARLQRDLKAEGVELGFVDATLAASADCAGASFATADETLWKKPVATRIDVVEYHRSAD